ncbi:uncharacterized protein N0V89_006998 [Didymosphaeria variabile]|uniref:Uncharacterized protein n=1 Tax=Didymosphaeria variabile TaxID=1932322 RepID=A0A9W9C9S4_9PLEO|nr:uncharacterized protein N0V89_006998 [Didymosphaeria variabile]KAJ4351655.1 hypothetical protein N0V89_006998 [Didymosphaeria variabile]
MLFYFTYYSSTFHTGLLSLRLYIKSYPHYGLQITTAEKPFDLFFSDSTLTNMSNLPSHAQPTGEISYDGWRNVIGIGHGKDWGTKSSDPSNWPAQFDSKPSAAIIEPAMTVSRTDELREDYNAEVDEVAKACGFWDIHMEEVAQKEAENKANEEKRRKLIELLRYNPNSRTTAPVSIPPDL